MKTWEKKETENTEVKHQTNKDWKVHYAIIWLAVIANTNQTFSIHRHKKFAQSRAQNVFHSQICTSCASSYRGKRLCLNFRNTGNWWDPHGRSKPLVLPEQIKQNFKGQSFLYLANRSRLWPVNHLYHHWDENGCQWSAVATKISRCNAKELFLGFEEFIPKIPTSKLNNDSWQVDDD